VLIEAQKKNVSGSSRPHAGMWNADSIPQLNFTRPSDMFKNLLTPHWYYKEDYIHTCKVCHLVYACVLKSVSYNSCVSFITYTTRMKQGITLNIAKIKCMVRQATEHINTVILKPRLVINLGKIYQGYVMSYKYPDNFRHLLVWKEDGQ